MRVYSCKGQSYVGIKVYMDLYSDLVLTINMIDNMYKIIIVFIAGHLKNVTDFAFTYYTSMRNIDLTNVWFAASLLVNHQASINICG